MSAQDNVQRVQNIYDAFGRGDVDAVLDALTDAIEWTVPGPSALALSGTRRGKQAVREWFDISARHVSYQVFEPRQFIAQDQTVVALVHTEATALPIGQAYATPEAHIITFRGDKVARFQTFEDTAAVAAAFHGKQ